MMMQTSDLTRYLSIKSTFKVRIIEILPIKSGRSVNGEWRKQEYVLETDANYPKKICFVAWGDKIDQFSIKQGENVEVSVDLESREYNGRWYTDVKAWKVLRDESYADNSRSVDNKGFEKTPSADISSEEFDDIPF